MKILVTGATGYVGGRLIPLLLDRGHRVTAVSRDKKRLLGRPWSDGTDIVEADLLTPRTLEGLFDDVDVAYYLVHSMSSGPDFADRDRRAARHFSEAAAHVGHTVYLGGLVPDGDVSSRHLRSRAEVGEILRENLPVTEFRAGPVIGSGSGSFEMVRYLTERLPVMVAPRWILNTVQPVSVEDVLAYLVEAAGRVAEGVVEIGADRITFRQMMEIYASVRGLRRWIVPVPVLTPGLAARWVGLVTPLSNDLAVPLIKGVIQSVVADTRQARKLYPEIRPVSYRQAVETALQQVRHGEVETRWSGAADPVDGIETEDREGIIREVRTLKVDASREDLYRTFTGLGGERGWLVWPWAWRLRGLIDQLFGGPGLRRGRRHPRDLLPGEAVDFWRVERLKAPEHLRLRAEMRMPGRAWLEWEALDGPDGVWLRQTALFAPVGLAGVLYWYLLYPAHRVLFSRMARAVAREAGAAKPEGGGGEASRR